MCSGAEVLGRPLDDSVSLQAISHPTFVSRVFVSPLQWDAWSKTAGLAPVLGYPRWMELLIDGQVFSMLQVQETENMPMILSPSCPQDSMSICFECPFESFPFELSAFTAPQGPPVHFYANHLDTMGTSPGISHTLKKPGMGSFGTISGTPTGSSQLIASRFLKDLTKPVIQVLGHTVSFWDLVRSKMP